MKNGFRWLAIIPLLMLALVACKTMSHDEIKDKVNMPAPVVEPPKYIFHRVKTGETMASIAKWYTGKEGNWKEIAEENPGMKPFALKKDDIIKVPTALATAHTDPPAYSTAPRKRAKKPAARTSTSEGTEEEMGGGPSTGEGEAVFGPR